MKNRKQISQTAVSFEENMPYLRDNFRRSFSLLSILTDRLCGLVVRVSGYRYRGPGFDPRRYQIF